MPLLRIEELLAVTKQGDRAFRSLIDDLARMHGSQVYQALFKAMFQLEMTASDAQNHWRAALRIQEKSQPRVSLRSALLEQLHCCANLLADPRIIEAAKLKNLYAQAMTDGLTRLYNQSYFKLQLDLHVSAAKGLPGTVFSLLPFDLDHFKQYNDRCGHLLGDKALTQVSLAISEFVPKNAISARYGGEEFAVLLPNTPLAEAIICAENIRALVEDLSFEGEDRLDKGRLTISGGIATYPLAGQTSVALIAHADSNLYQAKKNRNQIIPRTSNTRQIIRHAIHNIVNVFDPEEGNFKSSLSSDISYTGMLIKSDLSAQIGSDMSLRFPFPFWPSEHSAEARVRHIRNHTSRGTYLIGVEFKQPQVAFIENILSSEIYASIH
jgi:diguanylate cyclase (GGDEF)-like protein